MAVDLTKLTDQQKKLIARIDEMTREEMASKWRFAPIGDPFFRDEVGEYFSERFKSLGAMSPQISKNIGWGD